MFLLILLCLIIRSQWKFDLPCASDICHVHRPVSRDKWILVMEMEAGKEAHVAHLLLQSFRITYNLFKSGYES